MDERFGHADVANVGSDAAMVDTYIQLAIHLLLRIDILNLMTQVRYSKKWKMKKQPLTTFDNYMIRCVRYVRLK